MFPPDLPDPPDPRQRSTQNSLNTESKCFCGFCGFCVECRDQLGFDEPGNGLRTLVFAGTPDHHHGSAGLHEIRDKYDWSEVAFIVNAKLPSQVLLDTANTMPRAALRAPGGTAR